MHADVWNNNSMPSQADWWFRPAGEKLIVRQLWIPFSGQWQTSLISLYCVPSNSHYSQIHTPSHCLLHSHITLIRTSYQSNWMSQSYVGGLGIILAILCCFDVWLVVMCSRSTVLQTEYEWRILFHRNTILHLVARQVCNTSDSHTQTVLSSSN